MLFPGLRHSPSIDFTGGLIGLTMDPGIRIGNTSTTSRGSRNRPQHHGNTGLQLTGIINVTRNLVSVGVTPKEPLNHAYGPSRANHCMFRTGPRVYSQPQSSINCSTAPPFMPMTERVSTPVCYSSNQHATNDSSMHSRFRMTPVGLQKHI
jgi:hypothetical protein